MLSDRRRSLLAKTPLIAFLFVPFALAPGWADGFTSAKWHVLAGLAGVLLLGERWLSDCVGLPRLSSSAWRWCAVLAVVVVAGGLRHGLVWAQQPLVARGAFVALALAAFWSFRRTRLRLAPLRTAVLVAAAIVVGLGLAQFAGFDSLAWLGTGDHLSATFGNVNMAAQFLGLSLVILLSAPRADEPRALRWSTGLVAALVAAYLALAGTRSVALAMTVALGVLAFLGRPGFARLCRIGIGAVFVASLVRGSPVAPRPVAQVVQASKETSAQMRLAVWADTLEMIRRRPLGVGAGNFEHAFMPYALAGRSRPGEDLVFRSPHNEYLRLFAEEGLAGGLILLALLVALVRALHRCPAVARWRSEPGALLAGGGAFLAVEACFQFPFELAWPSLVAGVLLGLALACLDDPGSECGEPAFVPSRSRLGDAACVVLAAGLLFGTARLALAAGLAARVDDVAALDRACALDPRQVEACVRAAWRHSVAGEHLATRRGLEALLVRSPAYFPALKLLGEDLLGEGQAEAGCRQLRLYDGLFHGHSSLHERVEVTCPPAPRGSQRM